MYLICTLTCPIIFSITVSLLILTISLGEIKGSLGEIKRKKFKLQINWFIHTSWLTNVIYLTCINNLYLHNWLHWPEVKKINKIGKKLNWFGYCHDITEILLKVAYNTINPLCYGLITVGGFDRHKIGNPFFFCLPTLHYDITWLRIWYRANK